LPFVAERFVVATEYRVFDYKGIEGNHLHIASCWGNKEKETDAYLGNGFTRWRVLQETPIALYHCKRKPDGKLVMVWMAEISRKGIPEWIFKMTQLQKYPTLFPKMYSVLKN